MTRSPESPLRSPPEARLAARARLVIAGALALMPAVASAQAPGLPCSETSCANGGDDDGDGLVDCADFYDCCDELPCPAVECVEVTCGDGLDNDEDGRTD